MCAGGLATLCAHLRCTSACSFVPLPSAAGGLLLILPADSVAAACL